MRALVALMGLILMLGRPAAPGEGPPAGTEVKGPAEAGEKPAADLGSIWIYKKNRRIVTKGKICLQKGPLEYLACFKGGKDHESVVAVDCKPESLNLAFIAQNYKAVGGVKQVGDPDAPEGDPVFVYVEWEEDGKRKRVRAEELLHNLRTKKHMRSTAWIYTGSRFFTDKRTGKEIFGASVTGVLAAVYRDPYAIFNSPLDTGADDIFYEVSGVTPARGTPVHVIFSPATRDDVKFEDGAELPAPEGEGGAGGAEAGGGDGN